MRGRASRNNVFGERDRENCCQRDRTMEGFGSYGPLACNKCKYEKDAMQFISSAACDLRIGKYTYGHTEEAKRQLVTISAIKVMKRKRFCEDCDECQNRASSSRTT
jgi:hypothetical protein